MLLYIIRHGKTERDSTTGRDDDRVLVLRGVQQTRWLAERLAHREHAPTRVISSPIMRAHQTAESIAARCQLPLLLADDLDTSTTVSRVLDMVNRQIAEDPTPLAIIGHNPTFSNLVTSLVETQAGYFELSTGECAIVDVHSADAPDRARVEPGSCTLVDVMRMPN